MLQFFLSLFLFVKIKLIIDMFLYICNLKIKNYEKNNHLIFRINDSANTFRSSN